MESRVGPSIELVEMGTQPKLGNTRLLRNLSPAGQAWAMILKPGQMGLGMGRTSPAHPSPAQPARKEIEAKPGCGAYYPIDH